MLLQFIFRVSTPNSQHAKDNGLSGLALLHYGWSHLEEGLQQGSIPVGAVMDGLLARIRTCMPWVPRKCSPVHDNCHA